MLESKIKKISELAEKAFLARESCHNRGRQNIATDFNKRKQQAIIDALAKAEMLEAEELLRIAIEKTKKR